jgi:hypothetical protein
VKGGGRGQGRIASHGVQGIIGSPGPLVALQLAMELAARVGIREVPRSRLPCTSIFNGLYARARSNNRGTVGHFVNILLRIGDSRRANARIKISDQYRRGSCSKARNGNARKARKDSAVVSIVSIVAFLFLSTRSKRSDE